MVSLSNRVYARLIDVAIFICITLVGGFVIIWGLQNNSLQHWNNITYIIFLLYNIIMILLFGQTVGKKLVGIKVVDKSQRKFKTVRLMIREILVFSILYFSQAEKILREFIIPYHSNEMVIFIIGLILLPIDLIPSLINSTRNQLLHDIITNTEVIKVKK